MRSELLVGLEKLLAKGIAKTQPITLIAAVGSDLLAEVEVATVLSRLAGRSREAETSGA